MDANELRPLKGMPAGVSADSLLFRERRFNLLNDDLQYPVLVLLESALQHNLQLMSRWCADHGLFLAPHGKTTMCPQLYERQLRAGAWGITVATVPQAAVCLEFEVPRVLIANQVVGKANIASLVQLMKQDVRAEILALVDSVEGVDHLAREMSACGASRPLQVLLEIGRKGWRTGVRSVEEGRAVLAAIGRAPETLRFRGFEGFEGIAAPDASAEAGSYLEEMARQAVELSPADASLLLSIGGSGYLEFVGAAAKTLADRFTLILRSGCYVTHDHGLYARHFARAGSGGTVPAFRPALELWSMVQSVRDGSMAILNFGKRDCSYDVEPPIPLVLIPPGRGRAEGTPLEGSRLFKLNDQHAYLSLPKGVEARVGDRVVCGLSHPCTAFDKWSLIPVVDDRYQVIDAYRTYF